jgi:amidohydrolase
MMDKFGIKEVYGMHNSPGLPLGDFSLRKGGLMAAADSFEIVVKGKGSHAAQPHFSIDPVLTSAHIVIALQSIASRGVDPLKSVVVSVTTTHGGDAFNVIPMEVRLTGTVRTLDPAVRDFAAKRLVEVAESTALAHGAIAEVTYHRGYPVTVNHPEQTDFAASVAANVSGEKRVETNAPPKMGAEDFSYMLEARPGAFIFLGVGETANLHHPAYDFNDEAIPYGISYWVTLAETALAA